MITLELLEKITKYIMHDIYDKIKDQAYKGLNIVILRLEDYVNDKEEFESAVDLIDADGFTVVENSVHKKIEIKF